MMSLSCTIESNWLGVANSGAGASSVIGSGVLEVSCVMICGSDALVTGAALVALGAAEVLTCGVTGV